MKINKKNMTKINTVRFETSWKVLETMYQEQRSCRHRDFAYSCVHKCRWKHAQIKIDSNANPDKSQQKWATIMQTVFCASSWQVLETMYQEQRSCRHRDFAYSCVHKCRWKHAQIKIDSNANPDKSQQKCSVLCIELTSIGNNVSRATIMQTSWFCIFMCAQMSMKTCSNQNRQQCKPRQISAKVQCFVHRVDKYWKQCIKSNDHADIVILHIHVCTNVDENMLKSKSTAMQTPTNLSKSAVFCASSWQVLETMYQEQRSCRHRDFAYSCVHKCRWKHAQIKIDSNANPDKSQQKCSVLCIELTSIGNNVSRATIMQTSWFCIFMCAQMSMKTCSNQNREQCKPRQISAKVQCFVHRAAKYLRNNVSRATIMQTSWFCIFMCAQMSMKTCSNQNRQQCKPRQISAKV